MASGDRLAPIIIFSVLFIALTLAVVPQMIDIFYANAANSDTTTQNIGYEMIGGHQYQMWTTTTGGGVDNYSVAGQVTEWPSWKNVGLNQEGIVNVDKVINTRANFIFYDQSASPPSHHRLYVWIVRNNTGYLSHLDDLNSRSPFKQVNGMRDFIVFREYAYSGAIWDNNHNFYDVVSFAKLLNPASYVEANNQNVTMANAMGKYNITFFAGPIPSQNLNLSQALLSNHFSIQVGSDLMNMMTRSHIGMWNIVGDLFMFKSDELGMPVWLNMFISTILWICVGFAVLGVISRFIPTIPGL